MDLLKTLLIYMTMVYVSAVQSAPEPSIAPVATALPSPAAIVTTAAPQTPKPTAVPTPNITPNADYKTLKVGDKGDKVTTMQRRLAELGYYTGDVDGRFGNQTRRAVERFQYYQGLQVDGIAGKKTLTVLYEYEDVVVSPAEVTVSPSVTPSVTPTIAPSDTAVSTEETPIPLLQAPPATDAPATNAPTDTPAPIATTEPPAPQASETPLTSDEPDTTAKTADMSPLTVLTDAALHAADATEPLQNVDGKQLHPAALTDAAGAETLYIPLMELLYAKNIMVVPSQTDNQVEYAFMLDETNVYYLTYTLDENAQASQARLDKNRGDEIHLLESAQLADDVLYVTADEAYLTLGIACLKDAEGANYTVYMPGQALPEGAALPTAEPSASPDEVG